MDEPNTVDLDDPQPLARRMIGPLERLIEGEFIHRADTLADFKTLIALLESIRDGKVKVM